MLTRILARFFFMLPAIVLGMGTSVQARGDGTVIGTWKGTYTCSQGLTGLALTIKEATPNAVRALFHFYADPRNPGVPTGCFSMTGTYDATSRRMNLKGMDWILRPNGYRVVDFEGLIDGAGQEFKGRVVIDGCTEFNLTKVGREAAMPQGADVCALALPALADSLKVSGQIGQALVNRSSIDLQMPFQFGSADILPEAMAQLDELGRTLTGPDFVGRRIGIYGHTDSVGSDKANLQLSEARASAVLEYLVRVFGMRAEQFVTKGYGRTRLKRPDQPGDAANRRVEIELLPR